MTLAVGGTLNHNQPIFRLLDEIQNEGLVFIRHKLEMLTYTKINKRKNITFVRPTKSSIAI